MSNSNADRGALVRQTRQKFGQSLLSLGTAEDQICSVGYYKE